MTNPDRNGSQKGQKLVIVGGVAGGASCATRARRLDESAEILLLQVGDDDLVFVLNEVTRSTYVSAVHHFFVPFALISLG